MNAFVDPELCIGCTQCAGLCPAVFRMEGAENTARRYYRMHSDRNDIAFRLRMYKVRNFSHFLIPVRNRRMLMRKCCED